jgi:hypothetical protein
MSAAFTVARAADSLDALPPGAVVRRMIDNYGTLRVMIRACQLTV